MAENSVAIRLSLKDADTVKRGLSVLGKDGQKALKLIEGGSKPASRGLKVLNNASIEGQQAMRGMAANAGPAGSIIAGMGPAGLLAAAGIGAAVASGAGLLAMANNAAKTGDEFQKMSLRTGVSTESLSTLKFAAERSGAEFTVLENGIKRMTRSALEASLGSKTMADGYKRIGVEVLDSNGLLKDSETLMFEVADGLRGLESDSEKAALAQQLLGRSGADLLPLFKEGSKGIADLQQQAKDLGLEWSTASADDAAAYEDAMTNLSGAFKGMTNFIGSSVLPVFTEWINSVAGGIVFVRTFTSTMTGSWDQVKSGVSEVLDSTLTLVSNFSGHVWEIMKASAQIIWQPHIQAAQFVWDQIRFHIVVPVWNAIGQDVVGLVNKIIAQFNDVAGMVGVSIGSIDFTPLSTDAPKTLSERWDEGVENVLRNIARIQEESGAIAQDLKTDAGALSTTWHNTLGKMIAEAEVAGDKAAQRFLVAAKAATKANEQADIIDPLGETGKKSGETFKNGFEGAMSTGFEGMIRDQDFKSASESVGESMVDFSIKKAAKDMAEKTADLIAPWASAGASAATGFGGGVVREMGTFLSGTMADQVMGEGSAFSRAMRAPTAMVQSIGRSVGLDFGAGVASGITTFLAGKTLQMMGLNIPDEIIIPVTLTSGILGELAEGSAMWTGVRDSFNSALKAGVIAAGIGSIVGGEMTSALSGLGASVGFALGGNIGAGIGGAIGGLLGLNKDEKEERKRQALLDTVTEIQSQGGFVGFLKDQGISADQSGAVRFADSDRINAFVRNEYQSNEFVRQARIGLGISEAGARLLLGSTFSETLTGETPRVSSEVLDALERAGISIASGGATTPSSFSLNAGSGSGTVPQPPVEDSPPTNPDSDPQRTSRVEPPPPPPPAETGGAGAQLSTATRILGMDLRGGRVSQSMLRGLGRGRLSDVLGFLRERGFPHTSGTVAHLLSDIAAGGEPNRNLLDLMGIDIIAGRGANFTARRPLTMLVGDRGPEDVSVVPSNMRGAGSRQSGGNLEVHYHIGNISTLDARSMRQVVTTELVPLTIAELKRASANGQPILHTTGLINR